MERRSRNTLIIIIIINNNINDENNSNDNNNDIIIIMIIIAFKIRNSRYFYNLTAPRTVSNTQVSRAQSCANHVQHIWALITCNMSCATWYERTAQLLSLAQLKSHLLELFLLAETINR